MQSGQALNDWPDFLWVFVVDKGEKGEEEEKKEKNKKKKKKKKKKAGKLNEPSKAVCHD